MSKHKEGDYVVDRKRGALYRVLNFATPVMLEVADLVSNKTFVFDSDTVKVEGPNPRYCTVGDRVVVTNSSPLRERAGKTGVITDMDMKGLVTVKFDIDGEKVEFRQHNLMPLHRDEYPDDEEPPEDIPHYKRESTYSTNELIESWDFDRAGEEMADVIADDVIGAIDMIVRNVGITTRGEIIDAIKRRHELEES